MPTEDDAKREAEFVEAINRASGAEFVEAINSASGVQYIRRQVEQFIPSADVDDVVQETMRKVLRAIGDGKVDPNKGSLMEWLRVTAINTAFDHIRKMLPPGSLQEDFRNAAAVEDDVELESTFLVSFAPDLSSEQVRGALEAIADYYRACGGVGLEIQNDWQEAAIRESSVV